MNLVTRDIMVLDFRTDKSSLCIASVEMEHMIGALRRSLELVPELVPRSTNVRQEFLP